MIPPVTFCITFGNRPALLEQTLGSLGSFERFAAVLGVNDFGDEASNAVFRAHCPAGVLVRSPAKRLQHVAVDAMYAQVATPLIMHCEDDWLFDLSRGDMLGDAWSVLEADRHVSVVAFETFPDAAGPWQDAGGVKFKNLGATASAFGSFSFRPSVLLRATWQTHGPYARFTSEGKIGRHLKAAGLGVARLQKGYCSHIGEGGSVAHVSGWSRMRRNILTRAHAWRAG